MGKKGLKEKKQANVWRCIVRDKSLRYNWKNDTMLITLD